MARVATTFTVVAASLALPAAVLALGLGDIELKSALNQPLNAEIEIINAEPDELSALAASVASRETFERYGLDRPLFLTELVFSVGQTANGQDILRVRSQAPVSEPFVTFLVEADWARGRLLREYTVLLDPPVFLPDGAVAPAPIAVPRGAAAQDSATAGRIDRSQPAPRAPDRARPDNVAQPAPAARQLRGGGSEYGPVRRGDTLWGIARRMQADSGLSMNQVMVSMYRANPQAFMGNMNLLREGATLSIPERAAMATLGHGEATAQVQRETDAWRSGRPSDVRQASATPSAGAAAKDPAASLRLVPPQSTASGANASAAALEEARSALQNSRTENASLNTRLGDLNSELEETRRLLSLKDSELAALQQQQGMSGVDAAAALATATENTLPGVDLESASASAATAAATETDPAVDASTSPATQNDSPVAEPASADSPAATTTPVVQPAVAAAPATEKTSLFATIANLFRNSWVWIAFGLAALLAAGVVLWRSRAKPSGAAGATAAMAAATAQESDIDDTVIQPAPRMPEESRSGAFEAGHAVETGVFEETGAFRPVDFESAVDTDEEPSYSVDDTLAGDSPVALDQGDPLSEADFHMAYGLYDQAAELVKTAADRQPERRDLQNKLLEIYFVWGNRDAFIETAGALRTTMGGNPDSDWDKIVIMGRQIAPEHEMFAGELGSGAGSVDLDLETSSVGSAGVDFDMDDGEAQDVAEPVDLDLGDMMAANGETSFSSAGAAAPDSGDGLDMEFGADDGAGHGSASEGTATGVTLDDLDMDLGLDFQLGGSVDSGAAENTESIGDLAQDASDSEEPAESDDVFGDFFAFSGDSDAASQTKPTELLPNDGAGELLPESPTGEFKVDLPPDTSEEFLLDLPLEGFGDATEASAEADEDTAEVADLSSADVDLDLGDLPGANTEEAPTLRDMEVDQAADDQQDARNSDTATVDASGMIGDAELTAEGVDFPLLDDDLTVQASTMQMSNFDETATAVPSASEESATMQAPFGALGDFGGPESAANEQEQQTVQRQVLGESADAEAALSDSDHTIATDSLDFDLGGGDASAFSEEESAQADTARVATAELALPEGDGAGLDEIGTKLDLARAYIDMGDPDGARSILEEVLDEGDDGQKRDAEELLGSIA